MAQLAIPESVTRTLYAHAFHTPARMVTIESSSFPSPDELMASLKDLQTERFVVKPDHTIGKRGKNNLLGLNLEANEVLPFIENIVGTKFEGLELTRFVVVPFIPHEKEYYVSFTTEPTEDVLRISYEGGVEIEDNWDKVQEIRIPVDRSLDTALIQESGLGEYCQKLLSFFREYGLVFLEINPLVHEKEGWMPLDFKARIDTASFFSLQQKLDIYALLSGLGDAVAAEEQVIKNLDGMTDASLKFKLLNPNARVWPVVAGGGASIIYFDSLVDKGLGSDIAFYGEYSGDPSQELMYEYAKTIINLLLESTASNKVLLLAGANANFTSIVKTFQGIQKAIIEKAEQLREQKVRILVRRGGPFVEEAFASLLTMAQEHSLDITIEGVERPLPAILEHITV